MNSKDIECPILNIVENDETCTLSISVHKENQSEDEIRMINDAIDKLLDLLPEVKDEYHMFGSFLEPLLFGGILESVIAHESQKCANKTPKQPHQFKVGDRVRFKTWEQLEKELGSHRGCMVEGMKHLCGTYATITKIKGVNVELTDFSTQENGDWIYFIDTIEPSPYYCGKVVCTKSNENELTVGKIYEVNDGRIKVGEDCYYPSIISLSFKSVEELNSRISIQFVEIKDE